MTVQLLLASSIKTSGIVALALMATLLLRRRSAAMLLHPGIGARAGTIVDGDIMAGGGEMSRDGGAHRAQSEEGHFCHGPRIRWNFWVR